MSIKFKDFSEIIFMAESAGILERFQEGEAGMKALYIEYMEMEDAEKEGFLAAKIQPIIEWRDQINSVLEKISGDK